MAYTRLRYHIILTTKKRRRWITPDVEKILYPALDRATTRLDGKLLCIGGVEDHVHMVVAIPPKHSISSAMVRLKSESTGAVKHGCPDLQNFKWYGSYACFTLNPANLGDIIAYVKNQKEHHRNHTLRDAYERFD